MRTSTATRTVIVALAAGAAAPAARGELSVVSIQPPRNGLTAPVGSAISVTFNQPVDPATVTPQSFWAFGRWSGAADGTFTVSGGGQVVTLVPDEPLFPGELVSVIISHDLRSVTNDPLRAAGYSWQFWTAAGAAALDFTELDVLDCRTVPQVSTRAYGGIATDLDDDGWADLTIVNEDSEDLRVFLNAAGGTGLFADFIQPTFPIGAQGSPNEASDFNRDGRADICVANGLGNSISVLLGAGNGHFAPQQEIPVGIEPRGIAVLDADGDGDADIVNTNFTSSTMSILRNNGNGTFLPAVSWEGGGSSEWALGAGDMNEDGIMDLVIGARGLNQVIVNLGVGNGTFAIGASSASAGGPWQLNVADVNGDGTADVACANNSQSVGVILLGDGAGNLFPGSTQPVDFAPVATDLGDLDGDGDLDWVTSSFAGDWMLFRNSGLGVFAFDQEFPSPFAASCALLVDIDNDCDLDLALVDELADVVVLQTNSGITPRAADLDGDCEVGVVDFLAMLAAWGPCPSCPPSCAADLDGDCTVGITDFLALLGDWG
jgi:hypothetical protein